MIGDLIGLALLFAAQGATGAVPAGEPVIVPGDVIERKAGEKADIFRLPVLADMDLKLTVDTAGDASATLYGADGKQVATTTGTGKLTLSARACGEGIYFLAISVAKAGTSYKVALGEPSIAWAAEKAPAPEVIARSQAMLEDTIRRYWLADEYPATNYMTPGLRRIADPKRKAESKTVRSYGNIRDVEYRGTEKGVRFFRVYHERAIVGWAIGDDGNQISLIRWLKVGDADASTALPSSPAAPAAPPRTGPAWLDKVTPLPVEKTIYGNVMPFPYGETISGNFAQAENRAAIGNAPTILYSFEGRKYQRVKAEVLTTAAHALVSLARDPAAPRMDIVSSDAQYKNEFNFNSSLDGYLPADGRYYVIVRAYAPGPKGQRDLVAPTPSLGEFTICIGDGGKRAKE